MPLGGAALIAAREVQVPILALLLIGACAAKAWRAGAARSAGAPVSPAIFPVRLRRPAILGLCAAELGLGIGLVLTAGRAGTSAPAVIARAATALLFAVAVATLNEMRTSRPGEGCGCFGDLSDTPVTMRSLARAATLGAAAVASIGGPPLRLPSSAGQSLLLLAAATAELTLIAALSPEVGEIMIRLGYREPCEVRRLPVSRTLASLRGSGPWQSYRPYLTAPEPSDIWREGCWRFVAYPGKVSDRKVDIVFAVYLRSRRPSVRAAVVDAVEEPVPVFVPHAAPSPAATAAHVLDDSAPLDSAPVVPPPRLVRPYAATLATTATAPLAAPGHPLGHLAPRMPSPAKATRPDQGMPRRPRFTPHRDGLRPGPHDRRRSSSV